MTPEQFERVKELFDRALSCPREAQRELLAQACPDDEEVRAEVERLLCQPSDDALLEGARVAVARALGQDDRPRGGERDLLPDPGTEKVPERLGPYRIRREIGRGDMGVVYEAEQLEPIRRRVALKLVNCRMNTRAFIVRIESERPALVLLSHPNIAAVYDAGLTPTGRPYFVMEYVEGEPLADYCDRHQLEVEERLALVIEVCGGVQHAHQKTVIHRDIKPSNVLVTTRSGGPVPKLVDFGVARATTEPSTEKGVSTWIRRLTGTPAYLSPEQVHPARQDVDTRTDVYSLGVLLYELLTGVLPFEWHELSAEGPFELHRSIRERPAPRPSARVRALGDRAETIARSRGTDRRSLEKTLSGDLDGIVAKAMEKDRSRRYASPGEMAADLRRHLSHEPVSASPPGRLYRLRKLVRRQRVGVAAATVVLLGLLAALVGTTVEMVRARQAERERAIETAKAMTINEFMREALGAAAHPEEGIRRDVTLLEALDAATARIGNAFPGQPEIEAAVRAHLGLTYCRLGRLDEAEPLLESALERRIAVLGRQHLDVAESIDQMAALRHDQGRAEEAEILFREALDIRLRRLGESHLLVAESLNNVAVAVASGRRDYQEAERLYQEALGIRRELLGTEHEEVARTMNDLGLLFYRQRKLRDADSHLREALRISRTLGGDDPLTLTILGNLRMVTRERGAKEEASRCFERPWLARRSSARRSIPMSCP